MKILRVIARLNIGGSAMHAILLTEGLDKRKFETILVCGKEEEYEGNMLYLAEEKGVRPLVIPELGRKLNLRKDLIAFYRLFCLIKKEKPDIIHTHTAKAGTLGRLAGVFYNLVSVLWFLVSGRKRCILIHTFHGHILHSYFNRIESTLFIWIERFLAIFTTKIIAVSESVRKELIALKISSPKKIIAIPLGLELDRYLDIENNSSPVRDYKSVGIIGRLVPVKNHKMFLDVAKRLKDNLSPRQKMKFLVVGDGPLRPDLESYTKTLGISEEVTFTGWIKDLKKIYSELDIVALTSLNEGTPVALLEAQAAARPCVATSVGGVIDLIEEGRSGFLVPPGDIENFIKGLIKLLNSPTLMRAMGKYSRDKVKDRFSKMRLVKDIEALYEQQVVDRKDVL